MFLHLFFMRRYILLFLAARLILLLVYVSFSPKEIATLSKKNFLEIGTDGYAQIAYNLIHYGKFEYREGWTVHNRPPLHPFVMSLSFVFPKYWFVFWFLTTLLLQFSALLTWKKLLFYLFKKKILSKTSVIALLLFFVIHPYMVLSVRTTTFLNEAILLWVLWLYFLAKMYYENKKLIAFSVISALLALTHGTLQIVPLAVPGFMLFRRINFRKILVATTVMLGFLFPWALRNFYAFGRFLPLYSGAGAQYWKGEESALGTDDIEIKLLSRELGKPAEFLFYSTKTPEEDAILLKLAKQDIQKHPKKLFKRFLIGLYMFWAPYEKGFLKSVLLALLNFPFVFLTFYAWIRKRKKTPLWISFVMLLLMTMWFVFAFFAANASFFAMFLPLLFLCFQYFWQDEPFIHSSYSFLFSGNFRRFVSRKSQSETS